MNSIFYPAEERGMTETNWLKSFHSFSFGNFYNPELMGFGLLRVLNDDKVIGGAGFARHPHDNMEILSIPLSGDLEHTDSTGKSAVIKEGDVQIMSAGSGIMHSEKNANPGKLVEFLQIWIFPEKKDITPHYDQKFFPSEKRKNRLLTIVDPLGNKGVKINQKAWLHMGKFDKDHSVSYPLNNSDNGIFIFVIEGSVTVGNHRLKERDALGISGVDEVRLDCEPKTELLVIEVPMS